MILEKWLDDRSPPVPGAFLPYLLPSVQGEVTVDSLLAGGMDALDRALRRPGKIRESAFPLLAADALVTYACEKAAQEPDFASGCRDMMASVGKRFAP